MDERNLDPQEDGLPEAQPRSKKKAAVITAVIMGFLVFAAYGLFSQLGGPKTPPSKVAVTPKAEGVATGQGAPEAYRELVDKRNEGAAQEASESGGSAVVTPGGAPVKSVDAEDCSESIKEMEKRIAALAADKERMRKEMERLRANSQKQGPSVGYDEYRDKDTGVRFQSAERYQQERERNMQIAQNLVERWSSAPGFAQVSYAQQGQTAPGNTADSGCVSGDCLELFGQIPAGTILYATLETGINSDVAGIPIMAEVRRGALKGARLIGNFKRSDDYVVLQFSSGTSPQGAPLKMNGVAVDIGTRMAGVADDVNRHYFQRYGALLGAAFLQGYGEIIRESLRRVEYVSTAEGESTPVETTDDDNTKVLKGSLATVGAELANQLKKSADRPPTVTMYPGSEIGILVVEPVIFGKN
jgi:intracellular multiplication protein IcmE